MDDHCTLDRTQRHIPLQPISLFEFSRQHAAFNGDLTAREPSAFQHAFYTSPVIALDAIGELICAVIKRAMQGRSPSLLRDAGFYVHHIDQATPMIAFQPSWCHPDLNLDDLQVASNICDVSDVDHPELQEMVDRLNSSIVDTVERGGDALRHVPGMDWAFHPQPTLRRKKKL